jgi:two-component system, NarL family, invasion response regulator UvrY
MTIQGFLKFLIVDDDALVRHAVEKVAGKAFPHAVIHQADCLEDAIVRIDREEWSIIILDLALGKSSGVTLIHQVRHSKLTVPILVLSSQREDIAALSVLKAGASGFLLKDDAVTTDRLPKAIARILGGETYMSDHLMKKLIMGTSEEAVLEQSGLSSQEERVLFFIARGRPAKEIADIMRVSEKTVRTYRARLLEKLGLKSDSDVVRYAIENRLVE